MKGRAGSRWGLPRVAASTKTWAELGHTSLPRRSARWYRRARLGRGPELHRSHIPVLEPRCACRNGSLPIATATYWPDRVECLLPTVTPPETLTRMRPRSSTTESVDALRNRRALGELPAGAQAACRRRPGGCRPRREPGGNRAGVADRGLAWLPGRRPTVGLTPGAGPPQAAAAVGSPCPRRPGVAVDPDQLGGEIGRLRWYLWTDGHPHRLDPPGGGRVAGGGLALHAVDAEDDPHASTRTGSCRRWRRRPEGPMRLSVTPLRSVAAP